MTVQEKQLRLPAFLASALINGDISGLSDADEVALQQVHDATKGWHCVNCTEQYYEHVYSPILGWFSGDVCEYTFVKYGK
jgi:hypothetical protein